MQSSSRVFLRNESDGLLFPVRSILDNNLELQTLQKLLAMKGFGVSKCDVIVFSAVKEPTQGQRNN